MTQPFYDADLAAVHESDFADVARSAAGVLLRRLADAGHHRGTIVDLGCGGGTPCPRLGRARHRCPSLPQVHLVEQRHGLVEPVLGDSGLPGQDPVGRRPVDGAEPVEQRPFLGLREAVGEAGLEIAAERPVSRSAGGSICRTPATGASGVASASTSATTMLITPSRRSSLPSIRTKDAVRTASRWRS